MVTGIWSPVATLATAYAMGTVPIHESVAKVATRDLLGVENGFAVSKTGHIALLRHNQIQCGSDHSFAHSLNDASEFAPCLSKKRSQRQASNSCRS
eukprot:COSAG06_NODE_807_length_12165_cov_8.320902_3_plen_96_part_00